MAKATEIPDCGSAAAEEGALLVLRMRLEEMLSFRDAALDWSDPAGVHDMRVATRRLRSVARDFGRYLPHTGLKKFRRSVKRLADALGEVRDADVALASLEESARQAPPELAAGFERVAGPKRARRKRARVQLFGALEAEAFAGFSEELSAALKPRPASAVEAARRDADQRDSRADEADSERSGEGGGNEQQLRVVAQTFREAGREVVERHLRRVVKLSVSLFRPADSEGLHELRIASKELRYSLELFSACWGGRLKPYAKEIARLQSSLGHVHDCDAWLSNLGRRLAAGVEKGEAAAPSGLAAPPSVNRRAALWLFRRYAAERAAGHAEALARWHAWENYDLLGRIRESLGPAAPDGATGTVLPPQKHAAETTAAPEEKTAAG